MCPFVHGYDGMCLQLCRLYISLSAKLGHLFTYLNCVYWEIRILFGFALFVFSSGVPVPKMCYAHDDAVAYMQPKCKTVESKRCTYLLSWRRCNFLFLFGFHCRGSTSHMCKQVRSKWADSQGGLCVFHCRICLFFFLSATIDYPNQAQSNCCFCFLFPFRFSFPSSHICLCLDLIVNCTKSKENISFIQLKLK